MPLIPDQPGSPNRNASGERAKERRGRSGAPTSYDVALAAGVAQSTVSRSFRDDSGISPATRARVRAIGAAVGYTPNALARSLILRRSNTVAVVVTALTLHSHPGLVHALARALGGASRQVLLLTVETERPDATVLQGLLAFPLDGLFSCTGLDDDVLERFVQRGIPVVMINRHTNVPQVDEVATDNARAAAQVAVMLHRAGRRKLMWLGGPGDAPVSSERREGFLAKLSTLGAPTPELREVEYTYAGGRDAFIVEFQGGAQPDAVFCANDQLAMGVIDACRFVLGVSVPNKLLVVGFDDVEEASRPSYDLTTLRQDTEAIANHAVALLLRREASARSGGRQKIRVPATLIRRGSAP